MARHHVVAALRLLAPHEEAAGRAPGGDPRFNIVGWNSSYTGAPYEAEVMRAWRDRTVERVLGFGPRRVWEIGCGTGLLLLQIAPACAAYLGTETRDAPATTPTRA